MTDKNLTSHIKSWYEIWNFLKKHSFPTLDNISKNWLVHVKNENM